MEPHLDDLIDIASEQGAHFISATPEIALLAAVLPWPHREPFDRFIAATSICEGLPLISTDTVFDELQNQPKWQGRIW
ncbi:MAG: PIN domain-containing protein [Pseudomonadota bacterium]|nr:PIN domain-containing protein [Pseudomonadota bacterium]